MGLTLICLDGVAELCSNAGCHAESEKRPNGQPKFSSIQAPVMYYDLL